IPPGHVGYITPRSGLAHSHGITVLNSPGTIDSGYVGEIRVNLINHGQAPYVITPGQRIAQLDIHPIHTTLIEQVYVLPDTARGANGHGSTGKCPDAVKPAKPHTSAGTSGVCATPSNSTTQPYMYDQPTPTPPETKQFATSAEKT